MYSHDNPTNVKNDGYGLSGQQQDIERSLPNYAKTLRLGVILPIPTLIAKQVFMNSRKEALKAIYKQGFGGRAVLVEQNSVTSGRLGPNFTSSNKD